MKEREMLDLCAFIMEGQNIISEISATLGSPKISREMKISTLVLKFAKLSIVREKIKPYCKSGILEIEELAESFMKLIKASYANWMMTIFKWDEPEFRKAHINDYYK